MNYEVFTCLERSPSTAVDEAWFVINDSGCLRDV
jgi:hypothetical protein